MTHSHCSGGKADLVFGQGLVVTGGLKVPYAKLHWIGGISKLYHSDPDKR